MTPDDYHITVRMGTSKDVVNLHGHLYLQTNDGTEDGVPTRIMTDKERSWEGASGRTYWIWGKYDRSLPRHSHPHPRPPFILKAGRVAPGSKIQRRGTY